MNNILTKIKINRRLDTVKSTFLIIAISLLAVSCSTEKIQNGNRIIIGIDSDVDVINPMYAFSLNEGNLIDLLFMKPAIEIWNESKGEIEFEPMLAEKWEWSEDKNSVRLYLRDGIFWSDGVPITLDDIIFTFEIYSNPAADTRFYGQFENFYTVDGLQIDIDKTFKVVSQNCLEINFKEGSNPSLLDINLEIIPKHIWSKYKTEELLQAKTNFEPVTSGPFKLCKWERESLISLCIDSSSFLFNPENVSEIVFKIIPDYKSRIIQLKTGAIDILSNIKSEDVDELKLIHNLTVTSLRGRDYDYIGWNHIDPDEYQNSNVKPNKFFSNPEIRKALSYAINRKEIVQSYLIGFGELCKGPISPMFKTYFDPNLPFYDYNPSIAREILEGSGWNDRDGDGIIEKNNNEFRFDLYIASGNPQRTYVANLVKNNLKAVGIEANIQSLEMGAFVDKLMKRDFDAWIAGWTIPIPLTLNPYWNSDPEIGFLNFSSYKSQEKDLILDSLQHRLTDSDKIRLYKNLQKIFYDDEPVTFLYWTDSINAYNKRITKIKFSMLGLVNNAWEWRTN